MRPIDADALMDKLSEGLRDGEALCSIPSSAIDNAPTIDAVPVVRCKDCVYAQKAKWRIYPQVQCGRISGGGYGVTRELTDFCSYGERRKKNDT